jgi:hypothetical protein
MHCLSADHGLTRMHAICSLFDPLEDSAAQTGPEGQNSTLIDALNASKLNDCVDSGKVHLTVPLLPAVHAAQCTSLHAACQAKATNGDACAGAHPADGRWVLT